MQQDVLLSAVERALEEIIIASAHLKSIIIVGAPLRHRGRLYNCAVAILRGDILAVTPKIFLPNYREFYEKRHFSSGASVVGEQINVAGKAAPLDGI